MTALFTLAILVLAASLGSWALSRRLSAQPGASPAALVFNSVGVICLIAAAVIAVLAVSRWSVVREIPVPEAEQRGERVIAMLPTAPSSTPSRAQSPPAELSERESNRIAPSYPDPIAQPPVYAPPRVSFAEWDATECVASKSAVESEASLMFLDNECDGVVAIVVARCPHSTPTCHASVLESSGWVYESGGAVLTTPEQRPLMDRIGEDGPLIAPTYRVVQPDGGQRIRYLACRVREPEALSVLGAPESTTDERRQRLRTSLERDACYARVLDLTRIGRGSGRSPDAVLSGQV